jgi:hypothetical protein
MVLHKRCPPEIFNAIVEEIYQDARHTRDLRSLHSLTLVCRSLNAVLTYRLFELSAQVQKGRGAVDWAIDHSSLAILKRVIEITPYVCDSRHVVTLIRRNEVEMANELLSLDIIQSQVMDQRLLSSCDRSPWREAIKQDNDEIIDRLYSIQGGFREGICGIERSQIYMACILHRPRLGRRFLRDGAKPCTWVYTYLKKFLLSAISHRDVERLEFLLSLASSYLQDPCEGDHPLLVHAARLSTHRKSDEPCAVEIVAILLDFGLKWPVVPESAVLAGCIEQRNEALAMFLADRARSSQYRFIIDGQAWYPGLAEGTSMIRALPPLIHS